MTETVNAELYDPFSQGGHSYLGSIDVEIGFAGKKITETPYDQDMLADYFISFMRTRCLRLGNSLLWITRVLCLG